MSKRRVEKIRAKFAGKITGLEEQIKIRDAKDNKLKEAQAKIGELTEELSTANEQIRALEQERAELLAAPATPQADVGPLLLTVEPATEE